MRTRTALLAAAVAFAIGITAFEAAVAQEKSGGMGSGMMQGGGDRDSMGRGMMRGERDMDQCMMMGSGMRGSQTDHDMMGSRMMGSGMMHDGTKSDMSALFGARVRPIMNLSVDDVRGYLGSRLEQLNNKRLKIGDLKSDEATITADIVTVDNSLVQQLKVNRHTGAIEYEN